MCETHGRRCIQHGFIFNCRVAFHFMTTFLFVRLLLMNMQVISLCPIMSDNSTNVLDSAPLCPRRGVSPGRGPRGGNAGPAQSSSRFRWVLPSCSLKWPHRLVLSPSKERAPTPDVERRGLLSGTRGRVVTTWLLFPRRIDTPSQPSVHAQAWLLAGLRRHLLVRWSVR